MKQPDQINGLLSKYPLISDQVDRAELSIILRNLQSVLVQNPSANIVEFGCYSGTTSLFIRRMMDSIGASGKFWAYDSFEGLPEKTDQDLSAAGVDFKPGELKASKSQFMKNFQNAGLRPPEKVIKSWFNELTSDQAPAGIGFAFLDGDYYDSIMDPLKLIQDKLAPGAVIIIDDYGNDKLPGAAKATHDWLRTSGKARGFKLAQTQASLAVMKT